MLFATGRKHGQEALRAAVKSGKLEGLDGFVERFGWKEAIHLLRISIFKGDVVVKSHRGPSFWIRQLIRLGLAKVTFIYRDPRDVMLSARDHARRTADSDFPQFQQYLDFEAGIKHLKMIIKRAIWWIKLDRALNLEYVKLLADPVTQLKKVNEYFGWNLQEEDLEKIVQNESKGRSSGKSNFNQGKISRYQEEMTPDQVAHFNEIFAPELELMGFPQ
ncbi:sulfotransferase domain-containing protein [Pontibacter sp. G13]|uniref:sulfotransferase domain-containing protein n=1 Tax=Pontibacter sp. G13 TaxID=3074898 RepID=UPI00288AFCE5|nr:sulfotransferase domain-containing protein [Pontibacter sp. G13]WNJ16399.1 sulfotransferase domain-containing protein [Pontibacter sp. G13]